MWEVENHTEPKARKEYDCDAWPWIDNAGLAERDFKPVDWETIQKARAEGFKILKGTKYIHVRGKFDGEFCTYRARLDLNGICEDYDLFDD